MAIEDGAVLMRALGMTDDIAEALQIYQRNRVDRTAKMVLQSSANRELFHLPTQDEIRARFSNATRARTATPGSIRTTR